MLGGFRSSRIRISERIADCDSDHLLGRRTNHTIGLQLPYQYAGGRCIRVSSTYRDSRACELPAWCHRR